MSGSKANIRFVGFCGADDSVHPNMLGILAKAYPFVEFGVLFRPDKEGSPRYASVDFVDRLSEVANLNGKMRLAAHLCGSRVNEVLNGDDGFLERVANWGFQRVQINATAVNGVDTSNLASAAPNLLGVAAKFHQLEFIVQKNDETRPLWEGALQLTEQGKKWPPNISMLVDESKGTGVLASSWPSPGGSYPIGYAGGIGPANIEKVLTDVCEASRGEPFWIDMESRLRSKKEGVDVFDLDKCYQVINAVVSHPQLSLSHPDYL